MKPLHWAVPGLIAIWAQAEANCKRQQESAMAA